MSVRASCALLAASVACGMATAGVMATGSGTNREEALQAAQAAALAQSAGVFVLHEAETTSTGHSSRTRQYTGGLVIHTRIVDEQLHPDGRWSVTVDAQVAPGKDNRVSGQAEDAALRTGVAALAATAMQQRAFTPALDEQPAFEVVPEQVSAQLRSRDLVLRARVRITWRPKFIDDVLLYVRQAGKPADLRPGDARGVVVCAVPQRAILPRPRLCWELHQPIAALRAVYLLRGTLAGAGANGGDRIVELPVEADSLRTESPAGVILWPDGRQVMEISVPVPLAQASQLGGLTLEVVRWRPATPTRPVEPLMSSGTSPHAALAPSK